MAIDPLAYEKANPGAFDPAAENWDWLAEIGLDIGIGGGALNVESVYYGLKAQQGEYKAQAQNAEFAANQANIAARAGERYAADIILAGQQEAAFRGAKGAQDVAGFRAATAASGVEVGAGSAAEVERALRVNTAVEQRAIKTNAQRRASAAREAAANTAAGAVLGRASAANLRTTAGSINPVVGAIGATGTAAGGVIGQYLAYRGRR